MKVVKNVRFTKRREEESKVGVGVAWGRGYKVSGGVGVAWGRGYKVSGGGGVV